MATTLTTTASTRLAQAGTANEDASTPSAVIVLVSPEAALSQCNVAVANTQHAGAVTVTCVVDPKAFLLETLDDILGTVDQARSEHPGVPVVLVGHDDAEDATLLAGEALRGSIAGVVVTRSQGGSDKGERAA